MDDTFNGQTVTRRICESSMLCISADGTPMRAFVLIIAVVGSGVG